MGAQESGRRWTWVSIGVLSLLALFGHRALETEARAGTQQCNTECQSKMTDCILACDGMRSCEEACKKKGQSCVAVCSSDAGPPVSPPVDGGTETLPEGAVIDARSATARDAATRVTTRDR
jgi:hypothetical protein